MEFGRTINLLLLLSAVGAIAVICSVGAGFWLLSSAVAGMGPGS